MCDYTRTKTRHEVTINQSVKIECYVLAEPGEDLAFVWKFNQTSSGDSDSFISHTDDEKHYETNFTKSQVTFTPKTRRQFGQFLCSASNSIGKQEKPCVIQVVISDLPDPVFGCFFDNLSHDSFSVHCQTTPSSSGRQNYLLELYANDSTDNPDKQPGKVSTIESGLKSLKHAQENQRDISEDDDNDDQANEEHRRQQRQVKKLTSEAPSFDITDLQPDTSYNLMIYVINSKGRSPAASYEKRTPARVNSNQEARNLGQVQFINKGPVEMASSLNEKLKSYIKSGGDYLNNMKPLTSILLIFLLCLVIVVVVTLFVSRICRRPASNRRAGSQNRRRKARNSVVAPAEKLTAEKLSVYGRKEPIIERNVQLTPTSKARMVGLAGNGSDTSRETNTDSTLVSNGNSGRLALLENEQQQSDNIKLARELYLRGESTEQQEGLSANLTMQMLARRASFKGKADEQSRNMQNLYSQVIKRANNPAVSPLGTHELSGTPQVSFQSGSDCTSNNELQADHSEFHDQLLVACHDNISEPVYVISRNEIRNQQTGEQAQQLHILNPSELWHYSNSISNNNGGSISGNTQVSSIATGDSVGDQHTLTVDSINNNVCRLAGDMQSSNGNNEMPIPVGFLPNSLSIPVSLSDCLQFGRNAHPHRHSSQQDFLNETDTRQALCIANTNGSYLTLGPDGNKIRCSQSPYSLCCDQKLHYNQDFGAKPREQQSMRGLPFPNDHQHQWTLANGHSNEYHCSQTMDRSCKGSRQPIGPRDPILRADRRGSFKGGEFANQQQQQPGNRVKFSPQSDFSDQLSYQ